VLAGFDAARKSNSVTLAFPFLFFSIYDTDEILIEARFGGERVHIEREHCEMLAKAVDALFKSSPSFLLLIGATQINSSFSVVTNRQTDLQ